jgi:hypothetical protein
MAIVGPLEAINWIREQLIEMPLAFALAMDTNQIP